MIPVRSWCSRARDPDEDVECVGLIVEEGSTGEVYEVPMRPGKPIVCERTAVSDVFVAEFARPPVTGPLFVQARARDSTGLEHTTPAHEIFVQPADWRDIDDNPTHLLRLNEVSARDTVGDWVEIYNPSAQDVSLEDMILTNDILRLDRFHLPPLLVPAGGQTRIWIDGSFIARDAQGEAHLPLVLNRCRDEVVLLHRDGLHVVDAFEFKEEKPDRTMGRYPDGEDDIALMLPTPGATNESQSCADFALLDPEGGLVINEVMADNWRTIADAGNEFGDWVEIHNPTNRSVPTFGWRLRDRGIVNDLGDSDEEPEWWLSQAIGDEVPPGCFALLWCDNDEHCERNAAGPDCRDPTSNGELHTNFEINRWRDYVQLIDPCGQVVDCVAVGFQARDLSVGRVPDGKSGPAYLLEPTPGAPNRQRSSEPLPSCVAVSPERFKELFDVDEPFPCATLPRAEACDGFKRGDADADCAVTLSDAIYTLNRLFGGGPSAECPDAADADDDGRVQITDAVYTLLFLFAGGDPPPFPGPNAVGPDLEPDGLEPCTHSGCP